jgi:lipopolysaccharide transport system ATP-binding protein
MSVAIRVEHLSKKYVLHHQVGGRSRYQSLRDVIAERVGSLFRRAPAESASREEFYALRDVSFEINQGEAVGIIGRNGAGKSTLLKILSRITAPSEGSIEIEGHVASLLEVGTGFHPELTGRENIYLNGSILGMPRREITTKFDEIVAFAEVEKFLDTQVKRYSSGMYMRLAFAVAAHLDPEILIVDEVLAVGDAQFQERCMRKMDSTSKSGKTVIFVSHNMNAVQKLCRHAILLSAGKIALAGAPEAVIRGYLDIAVKDTEWKNSGREYDNPFFQPTRFALVDSNRKVLTQEMKGDEEIAVLIEGVTTSLDPALVVGFAVFSEDNSLLFYSLQTDTAPNKWPQIRKGKNALICPLPARFLNEGVYRIELIVSLHFRSWICEPGVNAPGLSLRLRGGLSDSPHWMEARPGLMAPVLPFHDAV